MRCKVVCCMMCVVYFFFFQAEDGIRDLVRSRGLGDVYKRQVDMFDQLALGSNQLKRNVFVDPGSSQEVIRVVYLSLIHI